MSLDSGCDIADEQFYVLNLDVLEEAVDALKINTPSELQIDNGHVSISIDTSATGVDTLFTTIPYEKGWKVKINGASIEPGYFEGLICLPLSAGENLIEMEYHIPGLIPGLIISVIAVCLLILIAVVSRSWAFKQ